MISKLDSMYNIQKNNQIKIYKVRFNQKYLNDMTLACISELCEMIRETPFKPWKKNQKMDEEKFKEELVDVFHFFLNLMMAVGMDPDELYRRFQIKNHENMKRQKDGY